MDIKIVIATHKDCHTPASSMYLPLEVGAALHNNTNFKKDNTGDNISQKNLNYSELTGLYWAWKNLKDDYVGLVHYRRYFTMKRRMAGSNQKKMKTVLSKVQAERVLRSVDIVLPKKRNYIVESLYSHYKHTMYVEPLDITGVIIKEKYPEYYSEFEKLKIRRSAHMFNMMIMKKNVLDDYCKWLFDVLFELEKRIKKAPEEYSAFHDRFYGRISELLLDVYIRKNQLKYKELNYIYIGKVKWVKKIYSFVMAKLFGRKYEKSF